MQVDSKQIDIVLSKNNLGKLLTLKKFETGIGNPVYLANKKFVLRIEEHRYENNPGKLKREATLFQLLSKFNIPIPKVICFDDSGKIIKAPFLLLEYIPGKTLKEVFNTLEKKHQQTLSYQLGALAKQIHSIPPKNLNKSLFTENINSWVSRNIKDFLKYWDVVGKESYLSKETKEEIIITYNHYKKLNWTNIGSLIHGDFTASNIQVNEGNIVGVFDFEYANIGDPLWDLQKLPFSFQLGLGFNKKKFLRGYGILEFTKEEKVRLKMHCLHQGVWEIWATVTKFMPFGHKEIKEGRELINNTLRYRPLYQPFMGQSLSKL